MRGIWTGLFTGALLACALTMPFALPPLLSRHGSAAALGQAAAIPAARPVVVRMAALPAPKRVRVPHARLASVRVRVPHAQLASVRVRRAAPVPVHVRVWRHRPTPVRPDPAPAQAPALAPLAAPQPARPDPAPAQAPALAPLAAPQPARILAVDSGKHRGHGKGHRDDNATPLQGQPTAQPDQLQPTAQPDQPQPEDEQAPAQPPAGDHGNSNDQGHGQGDDHGHGHDKND
jgi:hypothetical protein